MSSDVVSTLVRVAAVALIAYVWLILTLRVAGKRSLSKLNAFDLVVTVALGSTLATVIVSAQTSALAGAVAIVSLTLLQFAVSRASISWPAFRRLVRSEPSLLVRDGRILHEALRSERVTLGDLEAAMRKRGIAQVGQVAAVVLESDGSFSVIECGRGPIDTLSSVRRTE